MRHEDGMERIGNLFSWERCRGFVEQIYSTDRWFSNDSFQKTARFCARALEEAGLSQVEVLPLRADGRTRYGDWVISRAWSAKSASLRMCKGGTLLADYGRVPCSLSMYSAPTPPEGVRAQAVCIDGKNPLPDVRGCLIVTSGPARDAVPLALEGGAVGIVSDYMPLFPGVRDSREEMRDVSRWENDFILPRNDTGLFAFNLSPANGERLRRALNGPEPVYLEARVDAEEADGVLPTVSAALPGADGAAGEVLVYGHLYEPGANDNASGCALILELAHCLTEGIRKGLLPRPRRTIRFAMGHECGGSTGYLLAHPDRRPGMALVADMVGSETADRARLSVWHNPLANWSFMDAALIRLLEDCRARWDGQLTWEERPFAVGTDNMLGDPAWNMPTVALITEPALSYHSSLDTPERIEERVMRRNARILGAALLLCADREEEAEQLSAWLKEQTGQGREKASHPLEAMLWERAQARAVRALGVSPSGEGGADELPAGICGEPPDRDAARVPVRLRPGCLTFSGVEALKESRWQPAWNTELNLPLFWADGERTLWEIACLSGAETGDEDFVRRLEWMKDYFDVLARHGYVAWK